mmetsp:Transcript_11651/g.34464  ORF Transcript_11651/g.34464 Transcript_11651/m.34464 type:complete len:203 (-) Transcript_11651:364-972(-)
MEPAKSPGELGGRWREQHVAPAAAAAVFALYARWRERATVLSRADARASPPRLCAHGRARRHGGGAACGRDPLPAFRNQHDDAPERTLRRRRQRGNRQRLAAAAVDAGGDGWRRQSTLGAHAAPHMCAAFGRASGAEAAPSDDGAFAAAGVKWWQGDCRGGRRPRCVRGRCSRSWRQHCRGDVHLVGRGVPGRLACHKPADN